MTADHPDPAFPRLHGRPARGWVNDPNGCSYVDGRYHVFFQHNPDAPVHHRITWGHMSSTDLVHWRQHPVALTTRPGEPDRYGCWTGCVVDDAGVPTAVYSAVADRSARASVLLAHSDRDMVTWRQTSSPVAGTPDDPAVDQVRDPYVVEIDGHRYALQGAGHTTGQPRILVYRCDRLDSWSAPDTFLSGEDPLAAAIAPANIWECPNLFPAGDRWVLVVSLWRGVAGRFSLDGVRYLVGNIDTGDGAPRFRPTSGGRLDDGPCFYAPQVLRAGGRTLLWAWSWERGRSREQIAAAGWAGALTFCREVSLVGDVLVSRPAAEIDGLRAAPLAVAPGEPFAARAFDVELDAAASLWLCDGDEERLVAEITPGRLAPPRILVDGSLVEVFPGGPTAFTTRAYPTAASRWLVRTARRGTPRAWFLGP
jgi:beta-fructofuranosidase